MSGKPPQIIGIVGASCTGKTWLADELSRCLGNGVRLSCDEFYHDRGYLSPGRRARLNFDHPRSIDWVRFQRVLEEFQRGGSVAAPRYDFVTHRRRKGEFLLPSARFVIIDGLWLFRRASVRRHFACKIFLRGPEELCLERRLRRDVMERGRSKEQVLEQWRRQTAPQARRFVLPQEQWADRVLETPIAEEEVQRLAAQLNGAEHDLKIGI